MGNMDPEVIFCRPLSQCALNLRRQYAWFFEYYRLGVLIDNGVEFAFAEDDGAVAIFARMQGLKFVVDDAGDLECLRRFSDNLSYNLELLNEYPNCIVLDMGAYTGISSLSLAVHSNVLHVFAYEMSEKMTQRAFRNLELNMAQKDRITFTNQTIAPSDGEKRVSVFPAAPLFDGLASEPCRIYREAMEPFYDLRRAEYTTVTLTGIRSILRDIRNRYPTSSVFVKMDVEGQEQEILSSMLNEQEVSSSICAVIGEFHKPGLNDLFAGTEFAVACNENYKSFAGLNWGYFYALNKAI